MAGDATLGWWNSQLFLKVKISGETSRRKSQSFGDVWVESSRKRGARTETFCGNEHRV